MADSIIQELGERLRTQDNRITAHPLFIVQQRLRVWGVAEGWADGYEWSYDDGDSGAVDDDLARSLEAGWQKDRTEPRGYRRIGYQDLWEFVTACFSEQGCRDYIRVNGHNLREPRIYAESAHRNAEWIALRKFFLSQPAPETAGEEG